MKRLTYKSMCGDYGAVKEYDSPQAEIQTLRNALGKDVINMQENITIEVF